LRIAKGIVWIGILPLMAAPPRRPYTAESYDVNIQTDLVKQRLSGEVSIRIRSQVDTPISALELDAAGLQIVSVVEGRAPQYFERTGGTLAVVLTNPLRPDEHRTITIRYQAGPAAGVKFFADQVYTTITSDWMPCNDRPGERAMLHLAIAAPPDAKVAASGQWTATHAGSGQSVSEWQLDAPTTPSRFGFALGVFAENTNEAEGVKLRVLGPGAPAFDFEPAAAALRYLGERTVKRYPGQAYTQVFVHGDAIQSMAGLTLLPESLATGFGKSPDTLWLLTSELAQQWYGGGIGLKDWADLWLREGVSAFAADAFLAQRLGKDSYGREIERSRQIYNRFRAQGKDRPLSYADWTTRQEADGEIPIHKGVCFLFLVHELMGDSPFWAGLRLYTSQQWGQAAASEDLQKAFEAANPVRSAGKKGGAAARRRSTLSSTSGFTESRRGLPSRPSAKSGHRVPITDT
jgi:aminopeptidase N